MLVQPAVSFLITGAPLPLILMLNVCFMDIGFSHFQTLVLNTIVEAQFTYVEILRRIHIKAKVVNS